MSDFQRMASGRGSLKKLPELAEKLAMRRPMLVGSSLTGRVLRSAPGLLNAPVFTGYHANPDLEDLAKGAELFRKEQCDGLISVGGGSAMDTAKGIKALLAEGSLENVAAGRLPEAMPLPHLAIPGTAGSGAEATQFAVLYMNGKKLSLSHPDLRPDGVILDASLLESLPAYHRKSCALDALSQGIESYWSVSATEESKVHAFLAVIGVLDNLKAYLAGDPHAAEEMLDASYQSGKAIQMMRTTAAHAMSYQLTKTFGIAHGHACMLTLPILWEDMLNDQEMAGTLTELSSIMRLGSPLIVPRLLKGILYSLEMEIPAPPEESVIARLAETVNPERLGNHPVKLSAEEIRSVYRRAFLPLSGQEKQACMDIWKYYGEDRA